MVKGNAPVLHLDAEARRARQLDARSQSLLCLPCNPAWWTKTGDPDGAGGVRLVGRAAEALREWLERIDITKRPIFRAIDRSEAVEGALTPRSINVIVKRRSAIAGLEPGGVFRARTGCRCRPRSRRKNRAAGGDAAVPAPLGPGRELL